MKQSSGDLTQTVSDKKPLRWKFWLSPDVHQLSPLNTRQAKEMSLRA